VCGLYEALERSDSWEHSLNTDHHHGRPFRGSPSVCHHTWSAPTRSSPNKMQTDAMAQMFGVTGAGLSKIRHMQNGGKRARHSIDQWDRQSIDTITSKVSVTDMAGSDGSG